MTIPQSFVAQHCPCVKNNPCPARSAGCHAGCGEWREWTEVREAERRRLEIAAVTAKYAASAASATIARSVNYRAMKRERGIR